MASSGAADIAARIALEAFDAFDAAFRSITRRAKRRFEERDWHGARRDASERLDAYETALDEVVIRLDRSLGNLARQQSLWKEAKEHFVPLIAHRYDLDRAETFFNSVTRKMLVTLGINREVEFFYLHPKSTVPAHTEHVFRSYSNAGDTKCLVATMLQDFDFGVEYEDLDRDAALVAQEIDLHLWPHIRRERKYRVDVANAVFYRNKGAYIIGRIVADGRIVPLIIPLMNGDNGIYADAVLLHESEASVVFSFAFSYFMVDAERYDALIEFLRSILPHAHLAELYTSLGYNRHGKTEFYRELHRFVHVSKEQFVIAPGLEGAVMIVFTLPTYGFVFKVIKDKPCFLRSSFTTPKEITQERVQYQYRFVSHRDRAGRMVDTQEFENLRFKKRRFSAALLDELAQAAKNSVTVTDDYVILQHAYVQRRVLPLPLYFQQEEDPEAIRRVLADFGYFLKDIAASGVFPCDLFNTWNYGVTNWGRVVLYDYDDVMPLERIRFREKPAPRTEAEETEPEENWIIASDEDFFVDEMERYSGVPSPLKGVFKSVHKDLFTLDFWNCLLTELQSGHIFDVFPYSRSKRFHHSSVLMS